MASGVSVVLKAKDRKLPGFEETAESTKWKSPFFFVQAADTQLGMIINYGDGTIPDQYPNVTWQEELKLCRQSVRALNTVRPKPAFFIICGDLVDAMPDKWPDIRRKQLKDLMEVYKDLDEDIPLVCVCGNHDVGDRPTPGTVSNYKSTFGDDFFSFWHGGVHFIVLNSQYYKDASMTKALALQQDEWLEAELAKPATHKIVFQHIPWFLRDPKEEDEYFNIERGIRAEMLRKFKKANVKKVFCGHYHRNAGGWDDLLEVVVTSAIGCQIGSDLNGMRVVKVTKGLIDHSYHGLEFFPRNVDL